MCYANLVLVKKANNGLLYFWTRQYEWYFYFFIFLLKYKITNKKIRWFTYLEHLSSTRARQQMCAIRIPTMAAGSLASPPFIRRAILSFVAIRPVDIIKQKLSYHRTLPHRLFQIPLTSSGLCLLYSLSTVNNYNGLLHGLD